MDRAKAKEQRRARVVARRAAREAAFDAHEEAKERARCEAEAAAARRERKRREKAEAQRAASAAAGGPRQQKQAPPPPTPAPAGRREHLSVLGVKEDTSAAIRSAYRQLVLRYHPDKNPAPTAAEMFRRVQAAYEMLTTGGA